MKEVVIVSGVRTAIGSFGGSLKTVPVVKLGSLVIKEVLKRVGVRPVVGEELLEFAPDKLKDQGMVELEKKVYDWDDSATPVQVDEVLMGNVLQAMQGQNTARQAMIHAGIPKEVNAMTINKICASGLKAITVGATSIMAGLQDVVIAGGMESMSCAPYAMPKARWGYRMDVSSKGEIIDVMVFDGIYEIFYDYHMGVTAENIAELYGISREEQDELGVLSHQRARAAVASGAFPNEIVPVEIPQRRKDPIIFDTDERPMDTNMEKMAKLATVFKKGGTVTAGNASGINDAAAAVLLMSREKADELGLKPIVKIKTFATGALDPAYMGLGPVPATRKALKQAGLTMEDIDVVELNEAFASQSIACLRELDLTMEKTNLLGSGISLGHPIGCTGARVTVTLMNEMVRRDLNLGLATMCIGGGQGMAAIFERV
ncbi:MAG: acetyl-CoA C-acetyltransferase [Proteobacteria bacterium]|nr:acetyl-CoA C-acetyltransferase [Pseudomonadota bacterium]